MCIPAKEQSLSAKASGGITLDIGCGDVKCGTIGIDTRRTSCVDIVADAYNLPFRDYTFDRVYMYEVLEHLRSPLDALNEAHRVLDHGGLILCSTPNVYWIGRIVRILRNRPIRYQWTYCEHINSWTVVELENMLISAKFGLKKVYYVSFKNSMIDKLFHLFRINKVFPPLTNKSMFFEAEKVTGEVPERKWLKLERRA